MRRRLSNGVRALRTVVFALLLGGLLVSMRGVAHEPLVVSQIGRAHV